MPQLTLLIGGANMIFEMKSSEATGAANTEKPMKLTQITPDSVTGITSPVNGVLANSVPAWCVLPGSFGNASASAAFENAAAVNELAHAAGDAQGVWMGIANRSVNSHPGYLGSLLPSPAVTGRAIGPMAVANGAVMGESAPQIGSAPGIWAAASNQYKDGRPVFTASDTGRGNRVFGAETAPIWQFLPFST
ncbi:hypothetical protein [Nitrospirillum viridazoti]|nr:hypothetical protein [Nitrospirillum amazonense]